MKRRILSILTALCLALSLLPVSVLAEDGELQTSQCICTSLCVEGQINEDCPVCGAEGYTACGYAEEAEVLCAKTPGCTLEEGHEGDCILPETDPSSDGDIPNSEQNEPTLDGVEMTPSSDQNAETVVPTADGTYTVTTPDQFLAAVAAGGTVVLGADITIRDTATLGGDLVLDLMGHTLTYDYQSGGYRRALYGTYEVDERYNLTVQDSSETGSGLFVSNGTAISGYFADVQILGGTIRCEGYSCINLYYCTGFEMSDGTLGSLSYTSNTLSLSSCYGDITMSGGTVDGAIGVSARVLEGSESSTGRLNINGDFVCNGTAKLSAENGIMLSGDARFNDGLTATSAIVIEDNVSVIVPDDGGYTRKIQFGGSGNVTINGGYFEVGNRHFLYCDGSSGQSKQFVINGGTFYQKTTENWTTMLFYWCTPIINGGVFKTDGAKITIGASWNAAQPQINGGYFQTPFNLSLEGDNNKPVLRYPSGYGMSTDTLGNLTGDTGEYADYYWLTKSTDITYDVNHDESTDGNTKNYTGKAYTTYAENSMKAVDSPQTYTAYNTSVPYRAGEYQFKGWATDSTADTGSQRISGLTANDTLYAVWDGASGGTTYTIQYDLNGGTGTTPDPAAGTASTDIAAPAQGDITRADYKFAGWSTDPEATSSGITGTFEVSSIAGSAQLIDGQYLITLYAVWTPKTVITNFSSQSPDYTGEPISFPIPADKVPADGYDITYYADYDLTEKLSGPPTDVGDYYVVITRPEDDTYAAFYQKVSFSIDGQRISAYNSYYNDVYDGKPHTIEITVKEPAEGYTIKYQDENREYTLDSPPEFIDPCSYEYIYYQITAPGYEPYTGSGYVNIKPLPAPKIEPIEVSADAFATGVQTITGALDVLPDDIGELTSYSSYRIENDTSGMISTVERPAINLDDWTITYVLTGKGKAEDSATLWFKLYSTYYDTIDFYVEVTLIDDENAVNVLPSETEVKAAEGVSEDVADKVAGTTSTGMETSAGKVQVEPSIVSTESFNALLPGEATQATKDDTITILVAPYLDITVKSYDETDKELTLDIEAWYRLKATIASSVNDIKENDDGVEAKAVNTVTLDKPAKPLDTAGTNVVITVPLPDGFIDDQETPVYVDHIKNGHTYVYRAKVDLDTTGGQQNYSVTFTNPHGFSTFVITTEVAASITNGEGTTYYNTLADAVNAVQNGETIKLLNDNSETITVSGRDIAFTIIPNGYDFDAGNVQAGSRTTLNRTGNATTGFTYTFDYTAPSGGSSSSGSTTYPITVESSRHGEVESSRTRASSGTTITLTVTPDNGYVLDELIVTDSDGDEISVRDRGNGRYTFTMPRSRVTVEATFTESAPETLPFVDVPTGAYYYDAVAWAVENGVTGGTSATTFSPDNACTRAQMVTFLWRAAGSPEPETSVNPFTDVSATAYYYEAVLWAVERGITNGTSATTFSPDTTVTRGQTVTFLWRNAGSPAASGNNFADVAADAYYATAVAWAAREGITSGTSATTFSPGNACTRAQIVTFLYRHMV